MYTALSVNKLDVDVDVPNPLNEFGCMALITQMIHQVNSNLEFSISLFCEEV